MAVIDRVKWDGSPEVVAWKFPSEELSTWTQLIVNETQEAFLVRGGVYEGPFGAGRHTLSTENIPLISKLINLPFGGKSPFSAEVWFVNKIINLDVKWGTPDPIQITDKNYSGIIIPVRAFGQYGIKITDSKKFLLKLIGTVPSFNAKKLSEYFQGTLITKIKTLIANEILNNGISVFEISAKLNDLSEIISDKLKNDFIEYGVKLEQFNIHSINVPESDPQVISLRTALAKKAEMGILGFNYQQERSFDVLQTAAGNEGSAGTVMGAGLGLGLGAAIGSPIANTMSAATNNLTSDNVDSSKKHEDKIKLLKEFSELLKEGILTQEEFEKEKKKILGN